MYCGAGIFGLRLFEYTGFAGESEQNETTSTPNQQAMRSTAKKIHTHFLPSLIYYLSINKKGLVELQKQNFGAAMKAIRMVPIQGQKFML